MYAKIFSKILDSSIADDRHVRHFFMDLLVLADSDGVIDMTAETIAARTRTPIEEVQGFLGRLSSPDPRSHTPDAEGRRIILLDPDCPWGWLIVNHLKYRNIATEDQRKSANRDRVKKHRLNIKGLDKCNANVMPCNVPVMPPSVSVGTSESDPVRTESTKEREKLAQAALTVSAIANEAAAAADGKTDIGQTIQAIWEQLCDLYKRPRGKRPGYEAERLLLDICQSPEVWRELEELKAFKACAGWFPESIDALISKWDGTLDRSKNENKRTANGSAGGTMPIWQRIKALDGVIASHPGHVDHIRYDKTKRGDYLALVKQRDDLNGEVARGGAP